MRPLTRPRLELASSLLTLLPKGACAIEAMAKNMNVQSVELPGDQHNIMP